MYLNQLKDNKGARYKSKRLGRGIGSGKGKTCARGGKGQTARSGVAIGGFEGGQNPLYLRLPKIGFNPFSKTIYQPINFSLLDELIKNGKLKPEEINLDVLKKLGIIKGKSVKVKLLGSGEINYKFNITLNAISKVALQKLEAKGGTFTIEK